jgi:hypothetical protein
MYLRNGRIDNLKEIQELLKARSFEIDQNMEFWGYKTPSSGDGPNTTAVINHIVSGDTPLLDGLYSIHAVCNCGLVVALRIFQTSMSTEAYNARVDAWYQHLDNIHRKLDDERIANGMLPFGKWD